MQQKELAVLLDISPAMVSRLAKQGMPTDDPERAKRWRKRHLEPARMKGSRAGTFKSKELTTPTPAKSTPAALVATVADMEAVGDLIDSALNRGNQAATASRTRQLRLMLRQSTTPAQDENMRLTVRAWVALLDYAIHQEAEIRHVPSMGAYLNAGECGERLSPQGGAWPAHTVMWECCDFDDDVLNGWPDDGDESGD
jgi:hypothetical protein